MKKNIFIKIYRAIRRTVYTIKEERPYNVSGDLLSHVSYHIIGNVGDTVLSQCVRNTFRAVGLGRRWNLIGLKCRVSDKTIKGINKSSGLVIGGGGLFLPDTNQNTISGWQWAVPAELLKKIEVPIIVYSVGYNYFRGQEPGELFIRNLKLLVDKSTFVGLRNRGSIETIKALVNDESLASKITYQPCTTTLIRKIYRNIPAKQQTGNIAVNMAFDRPEMRYGNNKEFVLCSVAGAIKEIQERGYKIYYLAHCIGDLEFVKYLENEDIPLTTIVMAYMYPHEVFKIYNKMDLVIGMRGHSQMIPFGLNCEIITLCSHDKAKWFLDDIGASDWCIELRDSAERLKNLRSRIVDLFITVHEDRNEETRKRLFDAQEMLWKITMDNLTHIKGIIKK